MAADRKNADRYPRLTHHKASGQGVVRLNGRDVYCGPLGTPECGSRYLRAVAEWEEAGRRGPGGVPAEPPAEPPAGESDLTVNEVMLAYQQFADVYYRKNGEPTSEAGNIRLAIRPLRQLHGHLMASDFGPPHLKAVRWAMISGDLCRNEVSTIPSPCHRGRPRVLWTPDFRPLGKLSLRGTYRGHPMGQIRERHSTAFKAKVALEAVKQDKTIRTRQSPSWPRSIRSTPSTSASGRSSSSTAWRVSSRPGRRPADPISRRFRPSSTSRSAGSRWSWPGRNKNPGRDVAARRGWIEPEHSALMSAASASCWACAARASTTSRPASRGPAARRR